VADERQVIRKLVSIEKRSAQILALFLLASLWFQSWPISLGLVLGGGVALLNFRWLWRIMEKYLFENKKHYGLQILLKFLALLGGLFLIIRYGKVNPAAFLVGLSTLVLGIFWEAIREPLRARRKGVW
jgi:hypothetical protein